MFRVGQYNSQKNYEWHFLRKRFELPKSCTLQWPLALQLFGGDRRHLVELILRDVDIFMIQIKGKRCGNFRVIERLFLRRTLPPHPSIALTGCYSGGNNTTIFGQSSKGSFTMSSILRSILLLCSDYCHIYKLTYKICNIAGFTSNVANDAGTQKLILVFHLILKGLSKI